VALCDGRARGRRLRLGLAVLVEMGLPVWQPPAGRYRAYVAAYGASRANGQAAAEVLGVTSR